MAKSQLICCVKNEGVFILEWLAHHRAIGFDDIVIYSNDCDDGTHELLDEAATQGFCRHFIHDMPRDVSPQVYAYDAHLLHKRHAGFAAVMSLDTDEFLNIHTGDGSLAALLAALPADADIASFIWRHFGAAPHKLWAAGNVTEQFKMAIPAHLKLNFGVKSIVLQPQKFGRMGNHHPERYLDKSPIKAVNAAGTTIPIEPKNYKSLYNNLRELPKKFASYELAQINHYSTKTIDAFMQRALRGRGYLAKNAAPRHTLNYFNRRNKNLAPELSIAKYQPALIQELATMRNQGSIAALEATCQERYRDKLAELETLE